MSFIRRNILGRVAIIAYGGYGPWPASKTAQIFAVLISRPSRCVRPESVQTRRDPKSRVGGNSGIERAPTQI
jgi:hypothetical protein